MSNGNCYVNVCIKVETVVVCRSVKRLAFDFQGNRETKGIQIELKKVSCAVLLIGI